MGYTCSTFFPFSKFGIVQRDLAQLVPLKPKLQNYGKFFVCEVRLVVIKLVSVLSLGI